jgi:hypothetical protein
MTPGSVIVLKGSVPISLVGLVTEMSQSTEASIVKDAGFYVALCAGYFC